MSDGNRRYGEAEMREVLRRAQRREQKGEPAEGLTGRELVETAREVGFNEADVNAALVEYEGDRQIVEAQKEVQQLSLRRFSTHLLYYLLINGGLLGLNLWIGPPLWFFGPLILWGVFLLLHLRGVLFPDPDRLRERARTRLHRRRLKESGKEFGHALTKGAAHLLAATAKKIDEEVDRRARPQQK